MEAARFTQRPGLRELRAELTEIDRIAIARHSGDRSVIEPMRIFEQMPNADMRQQRRSGCSVRAEEIDDPVAELEMPGEHGANHQRRGEEPRDAAGVEVAVGRRAMQSEPSLRAARDADERVPFDCARKELIEARLQHSGLEKLAELLRLSRCLERVIGTLCP